MKPIDMLVIGTVQEYQRLRTDIDQNLGVVFASVTTVSYTNLTLPPSDLV